MNPIWKEAERRFLRLDAFEAALVNVDEQDWQYILSALGDGGRDRFWKEVLGKLKAAHTGND